VIIGTAGHIDHGKSALVTALTGRPMDRLAEERRRGITIDLNFAPLRFEGLPPAGIVDVPGHEDFVRTMVAGASGIDLVLLVVDAVQGPQPQTWEHLAIVEQLGVPHGIPVLTKADLADPEWTELVLAELRERLARSPVGFEAPAVVSAVTGQGIPELAARLRETLGRPERQRPREEFRMPVDRVFSIAGVGTVVTGTPWSGALRIGDPVMLLPSGVRGRVRSLEAYGEPVPVAAPGARTAVGIAGIERAALRRGEFLLDQTLSWRETSVLDAHLSMLPGAPPLRRQLRVRVHLGTAEVLARVQPRDGGLARLALEAPVVARSGDRFVLRSYSPVATIGGGEVLDPLPPRRASWPAGLASPVAAERLLALVARRTAGLEEQEARLILGGQQPAGGTGVVSVAGRYLSREAVERFERTALDEVREFHRRHPDEPGSSLETVRRALKAPPGVAEAILEDLARRGELRLQQGTAALPDFKSETGAKDALLARALEVLERAGLSPPTIAELEGSLGAQGLQPLLRRAAQEDRVIAVQQDRYFSRDSLSRFVNTITQLAEHKPVTPSDLRDVLGLSRKFLIPLLEWSDRTGLTRRVGDARVLVKGR
jgi:selenocysteine-specific elongation factor